MKPKIKPFEQWTFQELVEYHQGRILLQLIAGRYEGAVFDAVESTVRWAQAQNRRKPRRKR